MPPNPKKQKIVRSTTTITVSSSTAPVSAIAARRQQLIQAEANASTPKIEEHAQVDNVDEEEKASLDSSTSNDSDSDQEDNIDNDDDDDGDDNSGLHTKSNSKDSVITPQYERRDRKLFLDPLSVSTFKPSTYNTAYLPSTETPGLILVGLKRGETVVFQGSAKVIPLIGYSTVLGYIISGSATKRSKKSSLQNQEPAELDLSSLSSFTIISPRTHALAVIESIGLPSTQRSKMVPQPTTVTSPEQVRQLKSLLTQLPVATFDTVIAIQSAADCGIAGIEKVVPLFKGILSIKQTARPRGTESEEKQAQIRFETYLTGFHPILDPTDSIAAMKIPDNWHDAIQALINSTIDENGARVKRPPVSVVCGGKKMGKSTFSRLILNRMLNRYRKVAFIECDIGQTEFTPVGMVALHVIDKPALGAPFTHPRQPHRAFFVGNSTPRDDPDYYMACIKELVKTYYSQISHTRAWEEDAEDDYHSDDDEDEHIPLIINTQGWIKGMGYDLLLQLLDYTAPSHIFGFHSPSVGESNLPQSFFSAIDRQAKMARRQQPIFFYVKAVALEDENNLSPFTKYHPADHRALSLLSYFYLKRDQGTGLDSANGEDPVWDFTQALVVRRPMCWNWRLAKGVWVLFDQVPPSQILHVLNGSLVALTGDNEDIHEEDISDQKQNGNQQVEVQDGQITPPNYFPLGQYPPPPPEHTTCHGLAIIRSIQPSTQTLHILTPIPLSKLKKCNGIVKGAIHMPLHANLDHNDDNSTVPGVAGVPWKKVPYLNYETPSGNYGSQSPATGGQSPRLGFAAPIKIIGSDAKVTRKNLSRKRLHKT